jgi:adenosylhomocysteine nucleosidase
MAHDKLLLTVLERARCYHDETPGGEVSQNVVVIAAHAFEARAAAAVGRNMSREPWGEWMLYRGELWELPYAVIRCGPGKVAAAAATQAAIQYLEPWVLLSFGTAGCHDLAVRVGTVVAATEVVDVALAALGELPVHIPHHFEPEPELIRQLTVVPGCGRARVACWEGHVASPAHRPPIEPRRRGGLVVVDWESAAVAATAEMWQVPWGALKVVSDHGETERLKLLAHVARRPIQWGAEVLRRACDAFAAAGVITQADGSKEEAEG